MSTSTKVLVVTNYYGHLHINPLNTKAYYQSQNQLIKDKQYKFREMDEKAAYAFVEENNGIDPDFKSPKEAAKAIADKDAEIKALREALEEAKKNNPEGEKLKHSIAELSTAPTSNSPYSEKAAEEIKPTAGKNK